MFWRFLLEYSLFFCSLQNFLIRQEEKLSFHFLHRLLTHYPFSHVFGAQVEVTHATILITRKLFVQYAGVAKPLASEADVSYARSCTSQRRRLVISPDPNALSFWSCFSSTSAWFFSIPLFLLAIWQCSIHLFSVFPFPEVASSRKCWVPVCWASSVLIFENSEAQLTSCIGHIKVLKLLFLK